MGKPLSESILKILEETRLASIAKFEAQRKELEIAIKVFSEISPLELHEYLFPNGMPSDSAKETTDLKGMMPAKATFQVLREKGKLMDVKSLYQEINRRGGREASIPTTVHRLSRIGKLKAIKAPHGNAYLYGLPEWFNADGTPKPEYLP